MGWVAVYTSYLFLFITASLPILWERQLLFFSFVIDTRGKFFVEET
jgi:hypothetical protein